MSTAHSVEGFRPIVLIGGGLLINWLEVRIFSGSQENSESVPYIGTDFVFKEPNKLQFPCLVGSLYILSLQDDGIIMKQCNHCGNLKDDSEFNWRYKSLGIRSSTCRTCKAKFDSNYYKSRSIEHSQKVNQSRAIRRDEARQFIYSFLSTHPCIDCGETDPLLLEFDHVRGQKKVAVSQMVGQGYSIESIQNEIAKCEVRCVSCHRRKTYQQQGWFQG